MAELSRDEQEIVELVRDFVNREVKPVVRDLEHSNAYPDKLIAIMKELGVYGLAIPEPWGESAVSTPCYALITEELARGWMSLAGAMGGHTVVAKLLLTFGTPEQQNQYLPRMATGELRATMALTEPGGGSDLQAMRTSARRVKGDGEAGGGHGYQVHIGPMYSDSRGTVKIQSTDPFQHPALRFNYLSTPTDRREWAEAIRVTRDILNQPAFGEYNAGELSPGTEVATEEQILDWVRRDAETALHPSCTARMGTGAGAVTDPATMRVHGLDGLRVVDASVMPYITNGNIYAPVMMTAEKAADLILGNTPLPPEPVPFYRHEPHKPAAEAR